MANPLCTPRVRRQHDDPKRLRNEARLHLADHDNSDLQPRPERCSLRPAYRFTELRHGHALLMAHDLRDRSHGEMFERSFKF